MEYIVVLVIGFVLAMIIVGRSHQDTIPSLYYGEEENTDVEKQIMSEFFDQYCEVITTHSGRMFIVWLETGERMCEVVDGHIVPMAKKNRFVPPPARPVRHEQHIQ